MTTSPVVTITEELVAELERLAESAIPGPWFADSCDGDRYVSTEPNGETAVAHVMPNDFDDESGRWFAGRLTEASHAFMAMANPATLLALLAERAAMQSQIKAGIATQDNLELARGNLRRLTEIDSNLDRLQLGDCTSRSIGLIAKLTQEKDEILSHYREPQA